MARLSVKSPAKAFSETKVSSEESRKKIAVKAYELWQKKGCRHGNDWGDWLEAEKAVKSGRC